jgi:hypothetical protein
MEVVAEVKWCLSVLVDADRWLVRPEEILDALAEGALAPVIDAMADIFPAKAELDAMLDALPADPSTPSLAVLHPYLPPASALRPHKRPAAHAARGFSTYARILAGLLQALATDRRTAKEQHVWALRHVLAPAIGAEDVLAVPTAPSTVRGVQQLTAYLLTAAAEEGWHTRALSGASRSSVGCQGCWSSLFGVRGGRTGAVSVACWNGCCSMYCRTRIKRRLIFGWCLRGGSRRAVSFILFQS